MLWSVQELRGMQLVACDGDVGTVRDVYFDDARWAVRYLVVRRVEDFLFDERSWAVEHLVVDTRTWWPGGDVVLPRTLVVGIDGVAREATLRVSRQAVKDAPPWNRDLAARGDAVRDVQRHFESSS